MKPKTCVIVEAPTVEPVSLSEVKAQVRLMADQTEDDAYLMALVAAARRLIEQRLGVALVATKYRAVWPAGSMFLELPNPPLLVGEGYPISITIDDEEVDAEDYEIDSDAQPAEVELAVSPNGKRVVVEYWAGKTDANGIAPQLRSALLLYVAHLYAHREAASMDAPSELPMGFETLLASESISGRW